jgi:hypothetical protein
MEQAQQIRADTAYIAFKCRTPVAHIRVMQRRLYLLCRKYWAGAKQHLFLDHGANPFSLRGFP